MLVCLPRAQTCFLILVGLMALGMAAARPAAQIVTFDFTYAGINDSNHGIAAGTITIDESLLNNPGITGTNTTPFVKDFSLIVSGAKTGNGTFDLSDYDPSDVGGSIFLDTAAGR